MSNARHALVLSLLCLAGVAAAEDAARRSAPITLRVMSFNVEWGGANVRFASVAEAVTAARADIAGIQEPEGNLERLAGELGWHFNRRNHVISRYPLIDPPGGDGRFLFVEVAPDAVVAIANVHLPSDPYGPYRLREGRPPAEVMALERELRLAEVAPLLDTLGAIHQRDVPVFLTGDFNAPSHEDWTEAASGRFPHRTQAFAWPVSRALAAAGFRDSYRSIHPDPVARPGFTWWAARPNIADYNPSDPADQDRIDFVWFAGPATVQDSLLVGEADEPGVSVSVMPWPSDHRAVVSEFVARPAPVPVLIATERRVHRNGESVNVFWQSPESDASIVLLREDGGDGTAERRVAVPGASGRIDLPTNGLPPGAYRVALLGADGRVISRNELWLLEPRAKPALDVGAETVVEGDSVPFAWRNAPGNRRDWIAIFDARAPQSSRSYLAYSYLDARSSGVAELNARTAREGWPLPPGRYVARLLEDDGFQVLAESAPFVVLDSRQAASGRE